MSLCWYSSIDSAPVELPLCACRASYWHSFCYTSGLGWVVCHQPSPLSVLGAVLTVVKANDALVLTGHPEAMGVGSCYFLISFLAFAVIHQLDKHTRGVILDVFVKPV